MKRQEGAGGERLQPGGLDVAPNEKLAILAIAASATAANPANCAIPANPFD